MSRNGRSAWPRTGGRHASESMVGMDRITQPTVAHEECDTFFTNVDGSPLTYSALTQAVKRAGKNADIPRLHCHLLRHTFAVRF